MADPPNSLMDWLETQTCSSVSRATSGAETFHSRLTGISQCSSEMSMAKYSMHSGQSLASSASMGTVWSNLSQQV